MRNKIVEANLAMVISKIFSGLNINALSFLLPVWVAPVTGVSIRVCFGAIIFWLIDIFAKPDKSNARDKILLFLLGALGIYGYMFFYLQGLSMSTPISAAIFSSLQPIWVFILMILFYHERVTFNKVLGILLGLGGAMLCIMTQKDNDASTNVFLGNLCNLASSIMFSIYLVLSNKLLKEVSNLTMLKYTFLGASFSALIINSFYGFHAPIFDEPIHWWPMIVLIFVLIFPTTISYMLVPIGLKYLSTTLVSIYGYIILVIATIVALILGQDHFSLEQMVAMLMICISVWLVEISEKKD